MVRKHLFHLVGAVTGLVGAFSIVQGTVFPLDLAIILLTSALVLILSKRPENLEEGDKTPKAHIELNAMEVAKGVFVSEDRLVNFK